MSGTTTPVGVVSLARGMGRPTHACEGRLPPLALSHLLGGRGVPLRRWLLPRERLRGGGYPHRRGPTGWGVGYPTQAVVAAWRAPVRDGFPEWYCPTGLGDGVSRPSGGRRLQSVCGGWHPP